MGQLGESNVSNQANTSDGYALKTGAQNVVGGTDFGLDVGDGGVVDLYGAVPVTTFYIADETSPGYVLQEDNNKIILEAA